MSLILAAEVPFPHIYNNEMLLSPGMQRTQQGIVESTPLNTLYIIFALYPFFIQDLKHIFSDWITLFERGGE